MSRMTLSKSSANRRAPLLPEMQIDPKQHSGSVDLPLVRPYNQLQSEGPAQALRAHREIGTSHDKLSLPARSFRFQL